AFEDGPDVGRIATVVREKLADLVVVASPHAARRLLAVCGTPGWPLAAVGASTARELPGEVIVPKSGAGADALVRELGGGVAGKRVLVARPEGGNPALVAGLRAAGARVETCILYRTVTAARADPAPLRELRDGRVDAIAFASGSAARGFVALAGAESAARAPRRRRRPRGATGADPRGLFHARRGWSLGRGGAAERRSGPGARGGHHRLQRGTRAGGAPRRALDGEAVRHQPPAGARAVAG